MLILLQRCFQREEVFFEIKGDSTGEIHPPYLPLRIIIYIQSSELTCNYEIKQKTFSF